MKKLPHKKRHLAAKAIALIARRRAKWLAMQRGKSVTKQDIAAGKQFAESFIKSLVSDPFWMQTIEDIAKSLKTFVNLAERQGAPRPCPRGATKADAAVTEDKIAVVRAGLLDLAKAVGKRKAKAIFIREGLPVRAPGSRTLIVGWQLAGNRDLVCDFWASPLEQIKQRVAIVVKKGKTSGAKATAEKDKENAVNGIEAPPRKNVYSPDDFLPTADDMIGLSQSASVMGETRPRGSRRAISKQKYEAIVKKLACRIALQRQCKPSPKEFAAAKKRVDACLRRARVSVSGAMMMGVSDIMAASFVLGAAAQGSPAAKLAIMKSVEAAKEGSLRAKKDVKALAEAKKIRQGKRGAPSSKTKAKTTAKAKVKAVAQKAAKKAATNAAKKGASKPQAMQAAKNAAAKVVKAAKAQKAKRMGPPHKLPPKRVAEARQAVRRSMASKKTRPKTKKEAVKRARLLRSFYGSPYPAHPAFRIHDI